MQPAVVVMNTPRAAIFYKLFNIITHICLMWLTTLPTKCIKKPLKTFLIACSTTSSIRFEQ